MFQIPKGVITVFSKRLRDLRTERGITQQQLADLLHLGRSTVAGYEVKGKQPDNARLCQIADFFGVSVDYLLGQTDDRAPKEPAPVPTDPAILEALSYLEGLSGEAMASALRCLQAIKTLDDVKGLTSGKTVILEKNA